MRIHGHRLRKTFKARGFTQESLHFETTKVDPKGKGVSIRCIGRASRKTSDEHTISEENLDLICKVLNVAPSAFHCRAERLINPSDKPFQAYQMLLGHIDAGKIDDSYHADADPGSNLWSYIGGPMQEERPARYLSHQDWADGIDHLVHRDILVKQYDNQIRVSCPTWDEMIEVLDMRLECELKAARAAIRLGRSERAAISKEMRARLDECVQLRNDGRFRDFVQLETEWHLCWAGARGAVRRLLRSSLLTASQVGDRMLWLSSDGLPEPKEKSYKKEFAGMVDDLHRMTDAFDGTPAESEIEAILRSHVDRSKKITEKIADSVPAS